MRGLKPADPVAQPDQERVAPYTGAWIETYLIRDKCERYAVAPYTGAWIETIDRGWPLRRAGRTLYGCVD